MPEREAGAPHLTSLAVWDLTSPVVAGRRATLKVGLACSSGCNLAGTRIDVFDHTGSKIGGGALGPAPWGSTTALYWTELDVAAPEDEGDHEWSVRATCSNVVSGFGRTDGSHEPATSTVRCVAVAPPEHRVTVEVAEAESGLPVADVELRVGRFRATTNEAGVACVDVPGGTYEIAAWKIGYSLLSHTAQVAGGMTLRLTLAAEPGPEQPYWM